MPLTEIAQEAVKLIHQNTAGIALTADLVTLGTVAANVVVQACKKGSELVTFLITHKQPDDREPAADDEIHLTKPNVAILVDINRRMLQDVARYLDRNGIEADLIVVTNDENYGPSPKFLDIQNPDEWSELVREFNATINSIKHQLGGAEIHFFLSAPMPIAFAIGSVWATVDEATVYHWEKNDYHPVMRIARELKS